MLVHGNGDSWPLSSGQLDYRRNSQWHGALHLFTKLEVVSARGLVIRTDNKKDDVAYIAGLLRQIIDKCLRGHKENPFLAPLIADEGLPKLQQSINLHVLSL